MKILSCPPYTTLDLIRLVTQWQDAHYPMSEEERSFARHGDEDVSAKRFCRYSRLPWDLKTECERHGWPPEIVGAGGQDLMNWAARLGQI